MSTPTQKETIYIDVDDEITAIIEKVHDSKSKILALVLPKRAATLQSTVNMRLLKRAAQDEKKSIVLITSEAALLPLAGVVGIHVARSLQSKPAIPPAPDNNNSAVTINDAELEDVPLDAKAPIGKLAGLPEEPEEDETIEVDNEEDTVEPDKTDAKAPPNKKLKVPDFARFRLLIILGSTAVVLLIIGLIWAFVFAPAATITIKTDTTKITSTQDLTASPSIKTIDKTKLIIPASSKQVQKTDTQKVPATGQKNNGTKASGTMAVYYCPKSNSASIDLPVGSAFSSNGAIFRTTAAVNVPASNFTGGGVCKKDISQTVNVSSDAAGDTYNYSPRSYTNVDHSDVTGLGSSMTGGTTKLVKAISQQDVDSAKQQILDRTKTATTTDLNKQFSDGDMLAVSDSIAAGDQKVTSSPNVGDEGEETTVSLTVTYTMVGMNNSDVKQIIEADVNQKIDPSAQQIQDKDDGLSKATIKFSDKKANGDVTFNLQVQVVAGPKLDTDAIKKEAVGKKTGDVVDTIKKRPGIEDVKVKYSPFWVLSMPKKLGKITVVFEQANGSQ